MRLRKINLAGFKSFVDPTTVGLPGDLIGIVGPNGCGKSNIIDAVRWVMGEVSAKHLRGDSMADVVFNGSTSRKPVGQASVELVFDNSEGRAGGQYAQYAEISVKRQVSREGQSSYFLNSTRCRRRDIMDIFLGTGLGPRSYAIIEQGMISRLIEARPEELRDFLEEAAGISKYKERRRETETRIRHTKENLDRLNDIREELSRQLTHLKRQSTMAEKYQVYKADEHRLKTELLGLRWRELDGRVGAEERVITEQQIVYESALAEQRGREAEIEHQRERHTEANEAFNETYRHVLDASADIEKTEKQIAFLKRRREQADESLTREQGARTNAAKHLADDQRRLSELAEQIGFLEPKGEEQETVAADARESLERAENAMQAWQTEWDEFNQRAQQPAHAAQGERARIQHLDERLARIHVRDDRLGAELQGLSPQALEDSVGEARERLAEADGRQAEIQAGMEEVRASLGAIRDAESEQGQALHSSREALQQSRGKLASLQALQQDALGKSDGAMGDWLKRQGLDGLPRLAEVMRVEQGWEGAVELVLGVFLEGLCDAGENSPQDLLDGFSGGRLAWLSQGAAAAGAARTDMQPLANKVGADWPVHELLAGVYVAEDLGTALQSRGDLKSGESVVTRDGVWLGPNWMLRDDPAKADTGILARERAIDLLEQAVAAQETQRDQAQLSLEECRLQRRQKEDALSDLQREAATANRAYAALRAELGGQESQLQTVRSRVERLLGEREELAEEQQQVAAALHEARAKLQTLVDEMARIEIERQSLSSARDGLREKLSSCREVWQAARDESYRTKASLQSMTAEANTLRQAQGRYREQVAHLEQRCAELQSEIQSVAAPLSTAEAELSGKLEQHRRAEDGMKTARSAVESVDSRLRELDQGRLAAERKVEDEREKLESKKLAAQEMRTRRQTIKEQLDDSGAQVAQVLAALTDEADAGEWERQLEDIARRIVRLGPINLAAIEEHAQQSERKDYLDAQNADLEEALNTLESAIQKIDRETRSRFKETYEKVNAGLERLFPRLFGGGRAYLELTGDDLLNTGVAVMARPPGKRNSTIHLLSGGEKALTAVALVFAIFELNPAPFCLLDEVDAPLDDANVGRFCEMIKEMSDSVQLIVITHNKNTMEVTRQLIGVTMHEPGVSRLVAVDMDAAVQMVSAG